MGATPAILEDLTAAFTRDVSFAQAPPLWVSLHDANPGTSGINEVTTGSGASGRQTVTFNTGSGGTDTSNVSVSFAVAASTLVSWVGYWTAQTGGTFLGGYPLIANPRIGAGSNGNDQLVVPSHGLSVGQAVRMFTIAGIQSAVPSGFIADTTYYVVTVVNASVIELSASSGGSAITPASYGGFQLGLDQSANFAVAGTFMIPATNLSYATVS